MWIPHTAITLTRTQQINYCRERTSRQTLEKELSGAKTNETHRWKTKARSQEQAAAALWGSAQQSGRALSLDRALKDEESFETFFRLLHV